jgi:sialic acid synthase SpsE
MFERVFIIAEAGSNHNGDLDTALELVYKAAESGADAVKFQDFTLETLFSPVDYEQTLGLKEKGWRNKIEQLSVRPEWHKVISSAARDAGIHYFSTPFYREAVNALDAHVPFFKIASGDITHLSLLEHVGRRGKGVFLSTGSSRIEEIERAVEILDRYTLPFICIMHCIMLYPPPDDLLHLNFIDTLKGHFKKPIGFSDHSTDAQAAIIAVSKGACALEKHLTLSRDQDGADHQNSLNPDGFRDFVEKIRRCESMLGDGGRPIGEREAGERIFARRGIYAAHDLKKGYRLSAEHVCFLRPCTGIAAEDFVQFKNAELNTDVSRGTALDQSMFS